MRILYGLIPLLIPVRFIRIGRKDVLDLKRRKKELSESIANKTESIIHEILSRTGSGGKRRAPLETTVNPSKAPSLRDLLGIRKLEDTFKIPKPPRRSEDDNVELPLASLADEMVASAEEEAALDPPAEPASPQAMVTNNDPLALDHDSVLPEKSDDVSAALALRKADQHTSPVRQEPLSDTSDEGKSSSRPEEMPKCGSPPTLKQVQSLRAILKPPPTIGEEFPPPPQLNQPIPLNPLGTILNTVVKPNGVPASQATTGNAESEAAAKQSVSVDAKLSRPQLNWTVQIITSPVRSKDDRPALPAATGVVPMETQSELIERHEPQASNVIVLSDSGDSCCSEPKIPKIDRMSMSLAPNAIKLPQQGRPQKKTKKVSFLAKNGKD
ncbi:Hypothetical protein NTJ_01132 [Nesidiocoris tenuis]|uniref:Uncharacterized protein n=1 Tax=Nesidiocoris tenuis TaxID=355587 RepID=A0ABN7A7S7_9HEMI|nr:Hypothetical protein NTJ_01132 [Nesidiocoris tenuis]